MPTIDVQVNASSDNADEVSNGAMGLDRTPYMLNVDGTGEWNGFIFRGISIPAGATILSAYLTFVMGHQNLDEPDVTIYGLDAASPPTFTTSSNDISGRTKTSASVDWSNADAGQSPVNTTDISTIVQELVDTYGEYSSGAMGFALTSRANDGGRDTSILSLAASATDAAKLHIEYSAGNAPPTIALETPDQQNFTVNNPSLLFRGSDTDGDGLTYQIQITDNPDDFVGGEVLTAEVPINAGTIGLAVHPQPGAGGFTWEDTGSGQRYYQTDDRVCQIIKPKGGKLKKTEFYFQAHENFPADTAGYYRVMGYEANNGVLGDTAAPWQPSTSYSLGEKVKKDTTANADQQFLYVCVTAGTSGGTEPSWTEIENQTFNDGSVVWEAHRGKAPVNYAPPLNTPTPNWITESDWVYFSPGVVGLAWRESLFTGADQIHLDPTKYYAFTCDWLPDNSTITNALAVQLRINTYNDGIDGQGYLDGASENNNGPRVGDDFAFRLYEEFTLLDKTSGTDSGFVDEDAASSNPFTAGNQISYTIQTGEELSTGTYYWRVRVTDPSGTGTWSNWSTARSFTVTLATGPSTYDVYFSTGRNNTAIPSGNMVMDAGLTIGRNNEMADGSEAIVDEVLLLAKLLTLSSLDEISFEESVDLSKFLSDLIDTTVTSEESLSVAKSLSDVILSGMTIEDSITVLKVLSELYGSEINIDESLTVAKALSLILDSETSLEESLTLLKVLDETISTSLDMEDSVSLSSLLGETLETVMSLQDSLTLSKLLDNVVSSDMSLQSSLAFAKNLVDIFTSTISGGATLEDALLVTKVLAMTSVSSISLEEILLIAKELSTQIESQGIFEKVLYVYKSLGYDVENQAVMEDGFEENVNLIADIAGGFIFENNLSVAKTLQVSQVETLSKEEYIVFSKNLSLDYNVQIDLNASAIFNRMVELDLQTQASLEAMIINSKALATSLQSIAQMDSGISLSIAMAMTLFSESTALELSTPLVRVYKIPSENRVYIIDSENRVYKIELDSNTLFTNNP